MSESYTYKQLIEWVPSVPPCIVDKVLVTGGRLIMFGKYKSWKSILAMHMGMCISTGTPWFGYKTEKTKVHVIQSEISMADYRTRVWKYAIGNGLHDAVFKEKNILFKHEPYLKIDTGYGINSLEKDLLASGSRVLILDPLYKAVSGHITDTFDVSKLTDNLDLLRDRVPNLTVIVVHHTRKTVNVNGEPQDMGSEEMIGSSYLANWCDSAVSIKIESEMSENFRLNFTCMRHLDVAPNPVEGHVSRVDLKVHHHRTLITPDELPHEY